MSNILIALLLAAGVATLAYTKLGRRVGYGNGKNVLKLVAVSFALSFILIIVILSLFHLHTN